MSKEYAVRQKQVEIPEWLAEDFQRRMGEALQIVNPIERRVKQLEIEMERENLDLAFLERATEHANYRTTL
jgi:hypothetical protein